MRDESRNGSVEKGLSARTLSRRERVLAVEAKRQDFRAETPVLSLGRMFKWH